MSPKSVACVKMFAEKCFLNYSASCTGTEKQNFNVSQIINISVLRRLMQTLDATRCDQTQEKQKKTSKFTNESDC